MNAPHLFKKTHLLALLLPVMMLTIAGCDDKSPMETFTETIGNFLKGLIDVGVAFVLGN